MKQSLIRQRRGSFDSQIFSSLLQSNFITGDKKKLIDDEIINYQIDDEFEMIEKCIVFHKLEPKNIPLPLFNNDQLHKISKNQFLGENQKLQLAATLIQQRGIPYLKRKAIWMTFIEKGDAKTYFSKKPPYLVEDQINKDVPRTGYDDKMNTKKYTTLLYRILCAYAIYNPKIGYTQGMNIICGKIILLLSIDGNDKQLEEDDFEVFEDEEEMFWMFVHLMKSMQDLFIQDVPGIQRRIQQLEQMLQSRCNEIIVHLQCNNIVLLYSFILGKLMLMFQSVLFYSINVKTGEKVCKVNIRDVPIVWRSIYIKFYSWSFRVLFNENNKNE
ncbi:unnamed protein product (macronuclear) [Paramecium tetraurelia]|uniref:Rab-GAP TBC domain-containing protein n=1 Tax=Paramecium tetraurelia TaxID=5888 RepID=A0CE29_PARTE|nr:uncharacterized protein GSPATT00007258001 [Paramecium tetraurelia]CAK69046.1 unnamed protein product [Paramecium tetraurelia]|eukprot:XP_001436443.1 hypothetical protein (macronuclear) [Paramecium tetraurelia strain d4-2]